MIAQNLICFKNAAHSWAYAKNLLWIKIVQNVFSKLNSFQNFAQNWAWIKRSVRLEFVSKFAQYWNCSRNSHKNKIVPNCRSKLNLFEKCRSKLFLRQKYSHNWFGVKNSIRVEYVWRTQISVPKLEIKFILKCRSKCS